jgi:hypothetical protein
MLLATLLTRFKLPNQRSMRWAELTVRIREQRNSLTTDSSILAASESQSRSPRASPGGYLARNPYSVLILVHEEVRNVNFGILSRKIFQLVGVSRRFGIFPPSSEQV